MIDPITQEVGLVPNGEVRKAILISPSDICQ